MFDENTYCPYTGLRSFTEEEAIYFKGRDEHIEQATQQLEDKKFLMLTGASGDGKSSLVFAGIIPHARAGFLKAQFSNWIIADFRPERTPFKNMCASVARALGIANPATVEAELSHGFSSLIDLYKNSKSYWDKNSPEWTQATDAERAALRRQSANLLILADQFEEFFTNPENYNRGVTSQDSNLVVNLLLESARIAQEQNIPVYVVCTMRSDYIGQCAAFRGLPEYIGYSQFFVPRLNRSQLQEVIEEPAVLSGNRISRRLTERLIHDCTEGIDQLPTLQHALNQIWRAADAGKEEMDLLHYAMVGGMPGKDLPPEDIPGYEKWFGALPEKIRECYRNPSLQNVLNTHASKLYVTTSDTFNASHDGVVSDQDARRVIRTMFACLTRIDHSRAVRNRMTLAEITEIARMPGLTSEQVKDLTAAFRAPENTLVLPYLTEEGEDPLHDHAILDITHESLIRNWAMLREWARKEYDKFTTFADLKQQVDRWIEHDRSWGFLLPIGQLTYFEDWYGRVQPNAAWVNRYNEHITETKKDMEESREIVRDVEHFLKLSARKHAASRAVMRLGPRRIAAVFALLAILVFSSFAIRNNLMKQNSFVLGQIQDEGIEILNEDKAQMYTKSFYLVNREQRETGAALSILENDIESDLDRFRLATAFAIDLNMNDPQSRMPVFTRSILYADSLAATLAGVTIEDPEWKTEVFRVLIELVDVADWAYYFRQQPEVAAAGKHVSGLLSRLVLEFMQNPWSDANMKEINEALEICLNHHSFSNEERRDIIRLLSPFEAGYEPRRIGQFYSREQSLDIGQIQDRISYNGLFLELAYLYASEGNVSRSLEAVDRILELHGNWEDFSSNAYQVAGYFALYGHWEALEEFTAGYAEMASIRPYQVYRRMLDRAGRILGPVINRFAWQWFGENAWYNPVLSYLPDDVYERLWTESHGSLVEHARGDELNFALALYYKQQGVMRAKRAKDRLQDDWRDSSWSDFTDSYGYYQRVSESYLNEEVTTFFRLEENTARRYLYLYPDYREIRQPYEPRSRFSRYYSDAFMRFILDQNLFEEIYRSLADLELVPAWINEYKSARYPLVTFWFGANPISLDVLIQLNQKLAEHPQGSNVNTSLIGIILANRLMEEERMQEAVEIVGNLDPVSFPDLFNEEFGWNRIKTFLELAHCYALLVNEGHLEAGGHLMSAVNDSRNRVRMYDLAALKAFESGNQKLGEVYVDSARLEIEKVDDEGNPFMSYRRSHAYALAMRGDEGSVMESKEYVSNLNSFMRYEITYRLIVRATAFNDQLYLANSARPDLASSDMRLITINQILYGSHRDLSSGWEKYNLEHDRQFQFIGLNLPL